MTTKTDGISSGLVAVGVFADTNRLNNRGPLWEQMRCEADEFEYVTLVRLSDAEALIAEKDAVIESARRLTRELDVIWNGDGAAPQASLCDLVCQLSVEVPCLREQCRTNHSMELDALARKNDEQAERIRELEKDVSASEDLMEMHCAKVRSQAERIAAIEAENERLRKGLKAARVVVEQAETASSEYDGQSYEYCICCGANDLVRPLEHRNGCEWAEASTEIDAAMQEGKK